MIRKKKEKDQEKKLKGSKTRRGGVIVGALKTKEDANLRKDHRKP
jgi:hypothetical protein